MVQKIVGDHIAALREAFPDKKQNGLAMKFAAYRLNIAKTEGPEHALQLKSDFDEAAVIGANRPFLFEGLQAVTATERGSRMGDAFGMALFGCVFAHACDMIELRLGSENLIATARMPGTDFPITAYGMRRSPENPSGSCMPRSFSFWRNSISLPINFENTTW